MVVDAPPPEDVAPEDPEYEYATIDPPEGGDGDVSSLAVVFPPSDGGPYVGFGLAVEVRWHSGLSSAPTAGGPRSKTVFWRLCAQSSRKFVSFVSERIDGKPQAPHIDTGDPNDVLLAMSYSRPDPKVLPSGARMYSLAGTYVYGMQTPADPLGPIMIPNTAIDLNVEVVQLDPNTFSRTLAQYPPTPPADYDGSTVSF